MELDIAELDIATLPDPSPVAARNLTIQSASALMQDVWPVEQLPFKKDSPSPFALFANPYRGGVEEALMITGDGELRHLKRDGAGWTRVLVAPKAKEVVVAIVPGGGVWGFYISDLDGLFQMRLTENDTWDRDPVPSGGVKRIKVAYSSGTPMKIPVVYHLSTYDKKTVMLWEWQFASSKWKFKDAQFSDESQSCDNVVIFPKSDDSPFPFTRAYRMFGVDSTKVQTAVSSYNIVPNQREGDPSKITLVCRMTPSASWVLPVAACSMGLMGLVIKNKPGGVLELIGSIESDPQNFYWADVGGVYFQEAAVMVDWNNLMHVYGIASSLSTQPGGTLSVLHQTGWRKEDKYGVAWGIPTWAQVETKTNGSAKMKNFAAPIDTNVERIFLDAYPDSSPTLLILHKDGGITLFTQDFTSGEWKTEQVNLSSTTTLKAISVYRTQITLVDEQGAPVPNAKLSVSATSLAQLRVGDAVHIVAPDASAVITTNAFGRVALSVPASGLTTPSLIFNAPGLETGSVVKPAVDVQKYLAGSGTLPGRTPLSGAVLKAASAKPGGPPLVPAATWGQITEQQAADSIKKIMGAAGAARGVADSSGAIGFMFQTFDQSRPAFVEFATHEELDAALAAQRAHPQYGGILEDMEEALHDLWTGIKRGAAKLASLVVNLANGVVNLVIKIGDSIVEFKNFVIKTLQDAANVVTAFFNALAAKVDDVVSWLTSLFDFTAIWNTKTELENKLISFPTLLQGLMQSNGITRESVKGKFNAYKADLKTQVSNWLRDDQNKGRTFLDLTGERSLRPGRLYAPETVLFASANGSITRGDIDGPQSNWLLDMVSPSFSSIGVQSVDGLKPVWERLKSGYDGTNSGFKEKLNQDLKALLNPADAESFGRIALHAFVNIINNLIDRIFQFIDGVIEVSFDMIKLSLTNAEKFLKTPITSESILTIVNWIYKEGHAGQTPPPLTLAGLLSLIMAFPVTLAKKLITPAGSQGADDTVVDSDGLTAGIAQLLFGVPDIILDSGLPISEKNTTGLQLWAIGCEMLISVFTYPREALTNRPARLMNWIPTVGYAVFDAGCYLFPPLPNSSRKITRQMGVAGKLVVTILGLTNFAGAIWENAVTTPSNATLATNILSPFSPMTQFLLVDPSWEAHAIKVVVDVISDLGGGGTRIAAADGK